MQNAASRFPWKAWLAAVLGLGAALSCNPAQAGDSMKLNVSAVILTRISCSSASVSGGQPKSRCSASDPRTTYRVRSDRDPRTSGPHQPQVGDPIVLSIEP